MKTEYVFLNNVQTRIITWGEPFLCGGQDVIIIIAGNPGITGFYIDFGLQLSKSTQLPVCIIGHAGHEEVPDEKSNILKGQENRFNLEGQLTHKLEFINNFIDKQSRLHLIGHSIGAWLILELLRNNEILTKRLASVNLLCPTIQKMAETTNVEIYLKIQSLPLKYSEYIFEFLKPMVGEKVLFLAYNEMDKVKHLNTAVLERIQKITYVIYSTKDKWAPVSYIDDLQIFQPLIRLEKANIDHAFVLKSSEKVAAMVSNFIKTKVQIKTVSLLST